MSRRLATPQEVLDFVSGVISLNPEWITRKVSASQIKTYDDCPRKWAYERHVEKVDKPWHVLGKLVHRDLEIWFHTGEPPSATSKSGKIALAGLHLYPTPDDLQTHGRCLIEGREPGDCAHLSQGESAYDDQADDQSRFKHIHDGVTYSGQMDLFLQHGWDMARVMDHKTCGTFDFVPTPEELWKNPQCTLYLKVALTLAPNVEWIEGDWVYHLSRQKRDQKVVTVSATARQIEESFEQLHIRVGKRLSIISDKPEDNDRRLGPICSKYGGCDHREECHKDLSLTDRIVAMQSFADAHPTPSTTPAGGLLAQAEKETEAAPPPAEEPLAEEPPKKRRRGRPPGSKNKPKLDTAALMKAEEERIAKAAADKERAEQAELERHMAEDPDEEDAASTLSEKEVPEHRQSGEQERASEAGVRELFDSLLERKQTGPTRIPAEHIIPLLEYVTKSFDSFETVAELADIISTFEHRR